MNLSELPLPPNVGCIKCLTHSRYSKILHYCCEAKDDATSLQQQALRRMQRKKKAWSLPSWNFHFSRRKQIAYGTNRKQSHWQKSLDSSNPILLSRAPSAALFEKWKRVFSPDPFIVPQGFWGVNLGYVAQRLRQRCPGINDPFIPTTSPIEVALTTEVSPCSLPSLLPNSWPCPFTASAWICCLSCLLHWTFQNSVIIWMPIQMVSTPEASLIIQKWALPPINYTKQSPIIYPWDWQ